MRTSAGDDGHGQLAGLEPQRTDLRVITNQAVLPGDLRSPGGRLVALAVDHREVEERTGCIRDKRCIGPRTFLPGVCVDLRLTVEECAHVSGSSRGQRP